jgi:hypothetical protein
MQLDFLEVRTQFTRITARDIGEEAVAARLQLLLLQA